MKRSRFGGVQCVCAVGSSKHAMWRGQNAQAEASSGRCLLRRAALAPGDGYLSVLQWGLPRAIRQLKHPQALVSVALSNGPLSATWLMPSSVFKVTFLVYSVQFIRTSSFFPDCYATDILSLRLSFDQRSFLQQTTPAGQSSRAMAPS